MKIKNKLGNLARLGRNQRYECAYGIPRLASGDVHLLLTRFPNLVPLPKYLFKLHVNAPFMSIFGLGSARLQNAPTEVANQLN